jgi:hypothetical protein
MMPSANRLIRVAQIAVALVALASTASAQTAAPGTATAESPVLPGTPAFAQLVNGQTVRVTTVDGAERQGRVTSLTSTGMSVDGRPVLFSQITRVGKVSHRVRTLALVGLGVGLGIGAGVYSSTDCEAPVDQGCGQIFGYAAMGVVAGAVGGAIMNHTLRDHDAIYIAAKPKTTVAFAPIVSATRKGVAFTMTWR